MKSVFMDSITTTRKLSLDCFNLNLRLIIHAFPSGQHRMLQEESQLSLVFTWTR